MIVAEQRLRSSERKTVDQLDEISHGRSAAVGSSLSRKQPAPAKYDGAVARVNVVRGSSDACLVNRSNHGGVERWRWTPLAHPESAQKESRFARHLALEFVRIQHQSPTELPAIAERIRCKVAVVCCVPPLCGSTTTRLTRGVTDEIDRNAHGRNGVNHSIGRVSISRK